MDQRHGTTPRPPDRRARGSSEETDPALAKSLFSAMIDAVEARDFIKAKTYRGRLLDECGWSCCPFRRRGDMQ